MTRTFSTDPSAPAPDHERRRRHRRGQLAETVAGFYLRMKGYRILARRFKTAVGEIDLVASRGRHLAFVEVKRRKAVPDAEASITARQRTRIHRAAEVWLARNPGLRDRDISFDVVFLLPWHWPRHIVGGL